MFSNNNKNRGIFTFLILLCLSVSLKANDSLLTILHEELIREFDGFSAEENPPYYMAFRVDEMQTTQISASFGSLLAKDQNKQRFFTPFIRIGDYSFDNTHKFEDDLGYDDYEYAGSNLVHLPTDNNKLALQHAIWRAVDKSYNSVLKQYNSLQTRMEEEESSGTKDFSTITPSIYFEDPYREEDIKVDQEEIVRKIKSYSGRFKADTTLLSAQVVFNYNVFRKYFLTSEGSSIVQNSMLSQLQIVTIIRNSEGNMIPQHFSLTGQHPNDFLVDSIVIGKIDEMILRLEKLKYAKPAEAYAGPAILSPGAAGVFFHEIFGHRIEGHRMDQAHDGQTFKDKLNKKVLPKTFSVSCDPTKENYLGVNLIGAYQYDDEGVKAEKVDLVQNGVLQNFLMSRQPTEDFSTSNGHSRAQIGSSPVSRQSNLIVSASKTYSDKDLRKMLISECKKQKKEYGYYFKTVIGGFTITSRYSPNVFNIIPSEVYRVYVDGRPDELVVGVDLIGTPLTMFSNIVCAGDTQGIFSGFCGAESGYIPVTAISPAIFVRKIETQKSMEVKAEIPILSSPTISE